MTAKLWIAAVALIAAAASGAQAQTQSCDGVRCRVSLTAEQMLSYAQRLLAERDFAKAGQVVAAMRQAPGMELETRYLAGFIAAETGDLNSAVHEYRTILADDPSQTRVRLELARVYLQQGKTASADHHFKLAQADQTLPPDIARVIRGARNVIRSRRAWTFNLDLGIAPDSNINNATDANGVTLFFGDTPLDFTLDENARARSGTGQTGLVQAGLRLPVAKATSMLLDLDVNGVNYDGADFDDFGMQLAAGPELRLSETLSVSAQALGAQRWYGGSLASRQVGARVAVQANLSNVHRVGLQIDARRTNALFDSSYDGWQLGAYASYEHAVSRTAITSASLFVRRDWMTAAAYSNTEIGAMAGIGAELPWGFNAGASLGASRALYDAPIPLFSAEPRRDWRLNGRLTLGNRKVDLLGFSPSVTWTVNRTASGIDYFSNERSRLKFGVARYF